MQIPKVFSPNSTKGGLPKKFLYLLVIQPDYLQLIILLIAELENKVNIAR